MVQIVLISGRICNGKSKLAQLLASEYNYNIIKTSEMLKKIAEERNIKIDRKSLQILGDDLDTETSGQWILEEVKKAIISNPSSNIVIDHIRTAQQLEHFRRNYPLNLVHVHLYAGPIEELEKRFAEKCKSRPDEVSSNFTEADALKNDSDVQAFAREADLRINTARSDAKDTFVRVAARLGLYSPPNIRCVDVIVGAQYGSEGKGHIAAYLSHDYDVLIRVGGPNAGHTVSSQSGVYTYHQLPSGARDADAKLLLGPGMTIKVDSLLEEIKDCQISPDRLFIDPQAMIIEDDDLANEQELKSKIASTGQGSGAAAARRILGRKPHAVRLAKDIKELEPYVGVGPNYRGSTTRQLEYAYKNGESILLEGTQGSGLSLFHGTYPYVTSRDTNVAGCLAEAGISPSRVRRVIMVVRPTPIRVANPDNTNETSGPLKHETTFKEIALGAKLDPEEIEKLEKTSTTKRPRRVGWFDWELFRNACALNAPTDIVLTFADYFNKQNREARRFERLNRDTIKFIEELERVAQAPVSLINTRFPRTEEEKIDLRSVIDRRNWQTNKKSAT